MVRRKRELLLGRAGRGGRKVRGEWWGFAGTFGTQ